MPLNSRNKGARGELAFAKKLCSEGYPARRGQQFKGTKDSPDVECESLPDFHFEIKAVEKLNVQEAMDKAASEASPVQMPVLAHKRNHCDWLITMRVDDWFTLLREYIA